ncbi:MAG: ABC transporter permease [Verrucomicrobiota bacterium]|nr:ABC transporter permease [Verrucomicrobiota bacterium]
MFADIRYGLRQLLKNPGFTIIAVLTLALGIGANTAIFSVVNAVLLKPLPFPAPERLVGFGSSNIREDNPRGISSLSYPDFFDFRSQNHTLANAAVYRDRTFALVDEKQTTSIRGERVSAEFFDVLGINPSLGRNFSRPDEQAGGGQGGLKVIMSHAFWQSHFGSEPNALGRTLMLDRRPYVVIGVLPSGFQFPIQTESVDLYTTIAEDAANADGSKPVTEQRGSHSLRGIARLKPGVSLVQANSDLNAIAASLATQFPDTNTGFGAKVVPLRDEMVGDVRTALGASRARIIRQLLTESVLLSGLGGALGLLIAQWGTEALIAAVPQNIPRAATIQLDGVVLGFTLLVSLGTGILFGLVPAWQASHIDLNSALKAGSRTGTGAQGKHRLRNGLVMAEVALALVLLVCAGLLMQSFARLGRVQPGLRTERLLTAGISLPDIAYPKTENVIGFFDQLLQRVRSIPGVEAVSTIMPLPLSGSDTVSSFDIEEHSLPEGQQPDSPTRIAGVDYFKTVGIPLLQGRLFTETDQFKTTPVAIVNERFAQKFFPRQNVIGKRIKPSWSAGDSPALMRDIVGVVGNVKHLSLRLDDTPEIYLPAAQIPFSMASLVVRTSVSNPASITSAIRSELSAVDRNIPLTRVRVFDEYMTRSLARPRFNALVLSIFAGTALVLTAIGIYGVMAYSVAQRTGEIGIRIALGAGKSSIFRLVVGQAMTLVAISLGVGIAAAFGATRWLNSLLYGVGSSDLLTFVTTILLVSLVAFLAAWLPARRATRVDPMIALRNE